MTTYRFYQIGSDGSRRLVSNPGSYPDQLFDGSDATSGGTIIHISTPAVFTADTTIDVWDNGQLLEEGALARGYTRDVGGQNIVFNTARNANSRIRVRVGTN